MKKTLPSLRVEEATLQRMNQAISKYNQKSFVKVNVSEFRRLSLEVLSQLILQDKPLPLDLE
ncbi:MAG: hypothetical protein NUV46_00580 [Nanoarchaeota archaeon]|nr:hypothetical protein [Nanoarchaeota archaeon]